MSHRRKAPAHIDGAPAEVVVAVGDLVLVRCANGTQIARIVEMPNGATDGVVRVEKWRDNSGRWTRPRGVPGAYIVGVPSANDPRVLRARAVEQQPAKPAKGA